MTMPMRRRKTKPPADAPAMRAILGRLEGAYVAAAEDEGDVSPVIALGVFLATLLLVEDAVRRVAMLVTATSNSCSHLHRYAGLPSSSRGSSKAAGRMFAFVQHSTILGPELHAVHSPPDGQAVGSSRFDQRMNILIYLVVRVVGFEVTQARPSRHGVLHLFKQHHRPA